MRDFEASIARIFSGRMIKGAGFLVSDNHLMTCAHVIAAALNLPRNTLEIPTGVVEFDLPLIAPNQRVKAKVVFWQPVKPGSIGEDIAVLEVLASETLPIGVKAVQLIIAEEAWGHTFRAYGFPQGNDDGVWVEGVIREKQASQWIQIEGRTAQGYAIESGFSGTPIWDENLKGVVGMTVAAEREREDARVAYLIPSTVLKQAWSKLETKPQNQRIVAIKNNKKLAKYLASTSILILVVFHLFSPTNLIQFSVVVLVISLLLVVSALLLVNTLEKSSNRKSTKIKISASILSLLTALTSSYLFISIPANGDGYTHDGSISSQYYTALQPFSVLSFIESKFSNEFRDGILKSSVSPLIYRDSPVYLPIEKFITESGNNQFIKNTANAYFSYDINRHGQTSAAHANVENISDGKRTVSREKRRQQSREDYELLSRQGEEPSSSFSYATVLVPFQNELDDAKWTSFVDSFNNINNGVGQILQYPKLSAIIDFGQKEENIADWKKNTEHDTWIRNIAKNNPNNRGFLGFLYTYVTDLSNNIISLGCGDEKNSNFASKASALSSKATATPYIRFADVVNNSKKDVRIKSIYYKMVGSIDRLYDLRNMDNRFDYFKDIISSKYDIKPNGFNLQPDQHFLIPIEFGFNTKSQNATFLTTNSVNKNSIISLTRKDIYISKGSSTVQEVISNKNQHNIQKVNLTDDFVLKTKSRNELSSSIPKRFAVGPIINLDFIDVDNIKHELKAPIEDPSSLQLFVDYGFGSCPYISIQHRNTNSWQDLGTILYGRSRDTLQDTEIRYLGDNIINVNIEEKDKEITYIDYLSFIYFDPLLQKDREVVPLISPATKKIDGNYYVLKQGEKISINIDKLLPPDSQKIRVKINGYYVPLPNNSK
jgi:hypothetical protein